MHLAKKHALSPASSQLTIQEHTRKALQPFIILLLSSCYSGQGKMASTLSSLPHSTLSFFLILSRPT